MANKLLDSFVQEEMSRRTRTREGAVAHATINDGRSDAAGVLDFFTSAGSMRGRTKEAFELFDAAYSAHPELAIRSLFYLRYFRRVGASGNGERKLFRDLFYRYAQRNDYEASQFVRFIPELGRWDDLFILIDNGRTVPLSAKAAIDLIIRQLAADNAALRQGKAVSLLPKWMPRENSSSRRTMYRAQYLARTMNMTYTAYGNMITRLSKPIRLLETLISEKRYGEIEYGKLPARAHFIHRNLFAKKDGDRYAAYLAQVEKGDKKIKTTGIQAHEVVRVASKKFNKTAELAWLDMLDQYKTKLSILPALDTSASMQRWDFYHSAKMRNVAKSPQAVAASLAAFFSEKNQGEFNNWIINFQTNAKMVYAGGMSLTERVRRLERLSSDHGATNVNAMWKLLLEFAKANSVPAQDMPDVIMVLSDMQFSNNYGSQTALEQLQRDYRQAGYEAPLIIFWNINAVAGSSPVKADSKGSLMVSGFNQDVLAQVLQLDRDDIMNYTPLGMMIKCLNSEPYAQIKLQ